MNYLPQTSVQREGEESKVKNALDVSRDKLTSAWGSIGITESDVRDVLSVYKDLSDDDLKQVLANLEKEGLVDVIFEEAGDRERKTEVPLLDRIRRLRPGKSLILEYVVKVRKFADEPSEGEYQIAAGFKNLSELVNQVEANSKEALISRLGILAHGGMASGTVRLGETFLTYKNIDKYAGEIGALSQCLTNDAIVLFLGCAIAGWYEGSIFLKKWSDLLGRGRKVVGFIVMTKPSPAEGSGGEMKTKILTTAKRTELGSEYPELLRVKNLTANEDNPAAKIAQDGKIIKWPIGESQEEEKKEIRKKLERRHRAKQKKRRGRKRR